MNPRTIPVKRRPVSAGFFKRIHAVTRNRTQRAATAACVEDLESPEHSARISRGFTIIVLFHVVAIVLYFVHLKFLNDHAVEQPATPAVTVAATSPKTRIANPPMVAPDEVTTIVVAGDSYARIAAREGVDEAALRAANKNKLISTGLTVKLPPKRSAATHPPEVTVIRNPKPLDLDRSVVETPPVETHAAPRALVAHPNVVRETKTAKAAPAAAGHSYVVKSGDNLYRICKRFKDEQAAPMKVNSISDPRKLSTGMTLVIPH